MANEKYYEGAIGLKESRKYESEKTALSRTMNLMMFRRETISLQNKFNYINGQI